MRIKRRVFSGAVCEQIVYQVSERADIGKSKPKRPRFLSEDEREQHKLGISRRKHARTFNASFAPGDIYCTLTFDDENEVHDFSDAKRLRTNYMRCLRRACPDARIRIYMGRGKNTHRIHMHMVCHGVPEDVIRGKWIYGDVKHLVRLREHNYYNKVDYGADYTGLANYLFDHWTTEQGGHRWAQTKNMLQPQAEPAREAVREYDEDHPPLAPRGYILVEHQKTAYGYYIFKYVKQPAKTRKKTG